jgi:hypothetical protein
VNSNDLKVLETIKEVDLMPAPDVYGNGLINPLPENDPIASLPYKGVLSVAAIKHKKE